MNAVSECLSNLRNEVSEASCLTFEGSLFQGTAAPP